MSIASSAGAGTLFGHRPFFLYFWSRSLSAFSRQIAMVAVGWQVYAMTNSAFDLGMIGLMQFLPTALLTFVAGHAADRYERKRVVQACQILSGLTSAFLAYGTFAGTLTETQIFAAVTVFGFATAFESPAVAAMLPAVAPEGMLQKATALSTSAFHIAVVGGPALGGLVYALSPGAPYVLMMFFWLVGSTLNGMIVVERAVLSKEPPSLASLFAGVAFVRANPAILGTISLDLFAVLLGGATSLMPIYARDVLHTGPLGLGILRAAPAIGALLMTAVLSRYAIERKVGVRMFQAVILFGVATVAFALSGQMWLSLLALIVMGAADQVSMVIRISLVQLATPDDMRGRVGAVNFLFVNASNQLGEFESGLTAAWLGAVPAAVLGGIGTILVALLWMKLFPSLRHVERLE
ncbi:MFS transporter [Beijerinckia mobilis]|uniref:MFS transporter n=1 Tax=Beijerinckia mobilis TaxID=231434 RepID=UPI000553C313|nr:MFS transporter [Beijerinckia mobilis]